MENITILLGAGFSRPAGFPLTSHINEYFLRNNSEELLNFTSGEWKWNYLANHADQTNGRIKPYYLAYGYILNQWVNCFSKSNGGFSSYEEFYQFIADYHTNNDVVSPIITKAFEEFQSKYPSEPQSDSRYSHYVYPFEHPQNSEIINIFNHLVKDLLHSSISIKELILIYTPFINYIQNFEKISIISLNHDNLLETIFLETKIRYSDGFTIENSRLVSTNDNPIKYFDNDFNDNLPLIKLHGSIDIYKYEISDIEGSLVRPTGDYIYFKTWDYYEKQGPKLIDPITREVIQDYHWNITPQFITGTRKDEIIKNDTMYRSLYSEFEKRIHTSQNLLIIGYSFSDEHVNDQIKSSLNLGKIKRVININLYDKFPYYEAGIKIINLESIDELNNFINI
jgi:hypothetical protein